MSSLEDINTWQLRALVTMTVIAWITQLARIIDILCMKYKLVGPAYYGRAASRISLLVWNLLDIITASLILAGSKFLLHVWVCSFLGYFFGDLFELAYHWNTHPKSFRVFILKHHLLGLLVAIMWTICRIYYEFPPFGVATAMLWHSSSALTELPMLYKAVATRDGSSFTDVKSFNRLMFAVFVLQRLWRGAVIIVIIASGFPSTNLEVFLIGFVPAICLDALDTFYQVKGLRRSLRMSLQEKKADVKTSPSEDECIIIPPSPE